MKTAKNGLGAAKSLRCRQVRRVVQAYLDSELDPALTARVSAHLEACRDCGLDADTYSAVKDAIANAREELPRTAIERLNSFARSIR